MAVMLMSVLLGPYLGCGGAAPADGMKTVRMLDLKAALGAATIKAPKPEFVKVAHFSIDNQRRDVLFMHPTSSAEFPAVNLTKGSWLQFGIGINEEAWSKGTDGVDFSVSARRADGRLIRLFSRHLDPGHVATDQRWIDVELPLDQFAGSKVALILETGPGPNGDRIADWAGWSSPRLFVESGK
jgi:hypothetical protein